MYIKIFIYLFIYLFIQKRSHLFLRVIRYMWKKQQIVQIESLDLDVFDWG